MSILSAGEDYLETILLLSKETKEVHAVDIAKKLGRSKPTVSVALKQLKDGGYIDLTNNIITLTSMGEEIALATYDKRQTITKLFIKFGVDEDIAQSDAHKIEHVISNESIDAIKEKL